MFVKKACASVAALRRITSFVSSKPSRGGRLSVDVLNNLKWKTLESRCFHMKASLMYKTLKDQSSPHLRDSFIKINEININYVSGILTLPMPKTIFFKAAVVIVIVVQGSGIMVTMRQKLHNHFRWITLTPCVIITLPIFLF